MARKNPAVDDYIRNAAGFAQPILRRLRKLVHQGCPDVIEQIKWGCPHFAHHGMLCHIAAFKQHCALGFRRHQLLVQEGLLIAEAHAHAMGHFGRITTMGDLPDDAVLLRVIRRAAELNASAVPRPRAPRKPPPQVPPELSAALRRHPAARKTFDNFSITNQREYAEWIAEARTDATRQRRLDTAIEWLAEGKPRNWKYLRA